MGTLRGFPNPPAMVRGRQSRPAPHATKTLNQGEELTGPGQSVTRLFVRMQPTHILWTATIHRTGVYPC